jgi:hypothetical protein
MAPGLAVGELMSPRWIQAAEWPRYLRPGLSLNAIRAVTVCAEDIEATIPDYRGITRDIACGG